MSWRAGLVWWLAWSAAGAGLIALPDAGPRLATFSFAQGLVLLLVGSAGLRRFLQRPACARL